VPLLEPYHDRLTRKPDATLPPMGCMLTAHVKGTATATPEELAGAYLVELAGAYLVWSVAGR